MIDKVHILALKSIKDLSWWMRFTTNICQMFKIKFVCGNKFIWKIHIFTCIISIDSKES